MLLPQKYKFLREKLETANKFISKMVEPSIIENM